MTHEELLVLLQGEAKSAGFRMDRNAWLVLCDVVELHKNHGECGMPASDLVSPCPAINTCHECGTNVAWPCPTIQAIEKELL